MTANRTQHAGHDPRLILELKIDAKGEVTRKATKLGRKDTLQGKLLLQLYPGIQVARVSVPSELTPYEQSVVEESMANLVHGKTRYQLVGAASSAKDGKFYFVDEQHARPIIERFQSWPEAAMTYFSIMVSDCKLMLEEPNLVVAVVKDNVLGTNDCRGWIRRSLYRKLNLRPNLFCQFRLAFDAREPKQAKGALKAMSGRVADRLGVDILLPESCCKPSLTGGVRFLPRLGTSGHLFTGPVILGIRQWSRVSESTSSYTLIEHASEESFQDEITVLGIENIRKVRRAWEDGDYSELLRLVGKTETDIPSFDDSFDPAALEDPTTPARSEWDVTEAVFLADRDRSAIRHPHVANHFNRILTRWAFRMLTSGGFPLPSFALADDGVLIEHEGKVYSASDWIPENTAITSLNCDMSLNVRYPIRMQEDLLPVRHLRDEELVPMLKQASGLSEMPDLLISYIFERQLRMDGTYILHSKTAAKNGGDFDFDTVSAVPSDRFPKFVAGRLAYGEKFQWQKNKPKKVKSRWWNIHLVAMKARGNKIGQITDLKTSCLAAGRIDFAHKLVAQLQNALDALKHGTEVDEAVISEIRKEVDPAPWLRYKRERKVSDLPMFLNIADTDKVGRLYNRLRKELGDLTAEQMSVEDFRGLFRGQSVTREMFEECQLVNAIYGDVAFQIVEREKQLKQELVNAQALWEAVRKSEDRDQRKAAVQARNKAQAALWEHEQDAKDQFSSLHLFVHYWAQGKEDNRRGWAQAMNTVVSNGAGTGAVLWHAFPQEVVDVFAEQTKGQSVPVRLPKTINGFIRFDDQQRAYLIERIENPDGPDGEKWIFLFQYKGKRQLIFENTSVSPAGEYA